MKNIKENALIWINFGCPFLIWLLLLNLSQVGLSINIESIKKIPNAISIYLFLLIVFTKWGWKLKIFRGWIVPFPNIQGTWDGTIESTWKNNNGELLPPIPVRVVIKQTFSSISCVLYTKESISYSNTAQINEDDSSGIFRLTYNYINRSTATTRDRSQIHDGAATLRIIEAPELILEGEYWTSRRTTGDIRLKLKTKKLLQSFSES